MLTNLPEEASVPIGKIFYSEGGGSRLVRNAGTCLQERTVSYPETRNIVNCTMSSVQLPRRQSVLLCYSSLDLCKSPPRGGAWLEVIPQLRWRRMHYLLLASWYLSTEVHGGIKQTAEIWKWRSFISSGPSYLIYTRTHKSTASNFHFSAHPITQSSHCEWIACEEIEELCPTFYPHSARVLLDATNILFSEN
jgi:hypothetical protein